MEVRGRDGSRSVLRIVIAHGETLHFRSKCCFDTDCFVAEVDEKLLWSAPIPFRGS
jgi:hypothetical protein